ncbi:MAG TPA: hypothetical protein PLF23_18885, partial [Candidatus Obscuribacter sp.]|nr:hypothetical protein [Candidatus Obscuribacter sp.]
MKRHLFALLSGALLLSGCTALQPSTSVHMVASNQPTFIDMDASRRGVVILPRANGQGYQFCAEPSPDVALEAVTRILAEAKTNGSNIDAKAEAEFRTAVVQLSKTQTSIRFLRESLYRICEQSVNQNLSAEQVTKLYELAITTALKLAEADVAKNQADLARELSDPKVREVWQQVFGAPPTVAPVKP